MKLRRLSVNNFLIIPQPVAVSEEILGVSSITRMTGKFKSPLAPLYKRGEYK